jgi:DNA-binding transcriptional ArsR family regulator
LKETEVLNRVFHALSDPTRRELLTKLSESASTITELAKPFDMTFAAVSKHLRVLEDAGLVRREVDGRVHRCSADLEPLHQASLFIEKYKKYWERQFDILDAYLKKKKD